MRILITGGHGMLGRDVIETCGARGWTTTTPTRADLDICDGPTVARAVADVDAVINCAAYTAVDAAEDHERDAFNTNATGVARLAEAAAATGTRLLHVSTDYVFAGDATTPYAETSPMAPAGAYGRTKAAGEWALRALHPGAHVVRTAWLYGAGGRCFPTAIAERAHSGKPLAVVTDQIGQPTWTVDVARILADLLATDAPAGTYHATATGQATWWDFATAIVAATGTGADVGRTTAAKFGLKAPRPAYSVLGHDALTAAGITPIGPWAHRWTEAAPAVLGDLHA